MISKLFDKIAPRGRKPRVFFRVLIGILFFLGLYAVSNKLPLPSIEDVASGIRASRLNPAPRGGILYEEHFDNGAGGWHNYTVTPAGDPVLQWLPWDNKLECVRSASPWWIDSNHSYPGAGYLHLVAFIWMKGYRDGMPYTWVDLRDSVLRFRIKTENLDTKGGHLYFWIQHSYEMGSRYWFQNPFAFGLTGDDWKRANLALTRFPIDDLVRPGQWTQVALPLSTNDEDWTNLGSSMARTNNYGSVPPAKALAKVTTDMGFIILPVNPTNPATGVVSIDDIEIGWPESSSPRLSPRGQETR